METRIKERLTGALILVAVFVLLVPELLSGRRPTQALGEAPVARPATEGPPLRSYTMDIGAAADAVPAGQAALNVRTNEGNDTALPAPAPLPAPVVREAVPEQALPPPANPEPKPRPDVQAKPLTTAAQPAKPVAQVNPVDQPRPAVQAKPAAGAATPVVPKLAAARAKGWSVQVGSFASQVNAQHLARELTAKGFTTQVLGGSKMYRVRVGPVADKAAAAALQSKLAAKGYRGSLAAP